MAKKDELVTQPQTQLTESEKFRNYVIREFGEQVAGSNQVTEYQQGLIQGYFIGIDRALKSAEEQRLAKNAKATTEAYKNNLPISWNTVDLQQLALDVKYYSKMGLDMMASNHLVAIPFKNKKNNNYQVTFIKGYEGIQYVATKYALNKPKNVVTELVYSNDSFEPLKRSQANGIESYKFDIIRPFDRGEVIGGFGYLEYEDSTKNRLVIMALKDILKRKPKYASAEFWGGKIKEGYGAKQVEVETDGWYDEMCLKTLKRYVYGFIEIDPEKIDENFQYMKAAESRFVEIETMADIEENANSEEFIVAETESAVVDEVKEPVDEEWQNE